MPPVIFRPIIRTLDFNVTVYPDGFETRRDHAHETMFMDLPTRFFHGRNDTGITPHHTHEHNDTLDVPGHLSPREEPESRSHTTVASHNDKPPYRIRSVQDRLT